MQPAPACRSARYPAHAEPIRRARACLKAAALEAVRHLVDAASACAGKQRCARVARAAQAGLAHHGWR